MPDIPEKERRRIEKAVMRTYLDMRLIVGGNQEIPALLLRLAEDSWRAGRAQGAERDL